MSEESIERYAKDLTSFVLLSFRDGDDYSETVKQVQSVIRVAIKESSEEKDEVIRRLVDSVDDPEKLLRALNTLG